VQFHHFLVIPSRFPFTKEQRRGLGLDSDSEKALRLMLMQCDHEQHPRHLTTSAEDNSVIGVPTDF
jgi:hypothetical protein